MFIRGVIIVLSVMCLFFCIIPSCVTAEILSEPNEIRVDLMQGEETKKEIMIINNGNNTMNGYIEVLGVECGWMCPSSSISIHEIVDLKPGESIEATITIQSSILNEVQEITFPIHYYPEGSNNFSTITNIHVTIHLNLFIYIGIPLSLIVAVLAIIVYIKRIKHKGSQ